MDEAFPYGSRRGYYIVQISPVTGAVMSKDIFDTFRDPTEVCI